MERPNVKDSVKRPDQEMLIGGGSGGYTQGRPSGKIVKIGIGNSTRFLKIWNLTCSNQFIIYS